MSKKMTRTRSKYLGDLIRRHPKMALMLEITAAGNVVLATDEPEEDPCPCDGDATLVTPNGGCEWGSTECPDNTVEPEDPDGDPPILSVASKSSVKMRLVGERRELAAKLLGKLVE